MTLEIFRDLAIIILCTITIIVIIVLGIFALTINRKVRTVTRQAKNIASTGKKIIQEVSNDVKSLSFQSNTTRIAAASVLLIGVAAFISRIFYSRK